MRTDKRTCLWAPVRLAVAAAVAAVPINSVVSDTQAVMCSTGCRQPRA